MGADANLGTPEQAGGAAVDGAPRAPGIARPWQAVALAVLTTAFLLLSFENVTRHTVVLDEYAHVPAGISYLDLGQYTVYRENPPLIQALAAIPVWLSGARMDYSKAGSGVRSEWGVGYDFLERNAKRVPELFLRARLVIVALGLLGGVLIARWSGRAFGPAAAVVCPALWLLDPNVLAFSGIVTSDVGAAVLGLFATYLFWCYLRRPSPALSMACGVALGLAQATKFGILALYPAWLALAAVSHRRSKGDPAGGNLPYRLASMFLISLVVLNATYEFEGTLRPLGSYGFKSRLLSGRDTQTVLSPPSGNRFGGTPLAALPVPLPRHYLLGIDSQKWEEEIGLYRMERGRLVSGGRWYCALTTLSLKLPVGTLILALAAVARWAASRRRLCGPELFCWVPGLTLLGLLCTQTGLNSPVRYALPALAFLCVGVGGLAEAAWRRPLGRCLLVTCLAANVTELAVARPCYQSFGNGFAGGSRGAYRYFVGSNYDWGQDLDELKRWHERQGGRLPLALAYYGVIDPKNVGIREMGLPRDFWKRENFGQARGAGILSEPFYWAVSTNVLNGMSGASLPDGGRRLLSTLRSRALNPERAVARVGCSLFVFKIDPTRPASPDSISPDELKGCLEEIIPGDLDLDAAP